MKKILYFNVSGIYVISEGYFITDIDGISYIGIKR